MKVWRGVALLGVEENGGEERAKVEKIRKVKVKPGRSRELYGLGRLRESSSRDTQEQVVQGALGEGPAQVRTPGRAAF